MISILLTVTVVVIIAAFRVLINSVRSASEGLEDATGFHPGSRVG